MIVNSKQTQLQKKKQQNTTTLILTRTTQISTFKQTMQMKKINYEHTHTLTHAQKEKNIYMAEKMCVELEKKQKIK